MAIIEEDLHVWVNRQLVDAGEDLVLKVAPLRQEASFRQYFRLVRKTDS